MSETDGFKLAMELSKKEEEQRLKGQKPQQ